MLKRMWINQPSTLQAGHDLHGTNVLAENDVDGVCISDIYYIDGPVISSRVPSEWLSDGWLMLHFDNKQERA